MSSVSAQYDEIWENVYGGMQSVGPVHRHMRRLLRPILAGLEYQSVLDVGCGRGDNIALLTAGRSVERVTGLDVSPRALDQARASVTGDFHQLDVQVDRLPGTWDLVFSTLLLEHLPDDDSALRNMRAMTGRHLVVTTIGGDFDRYRAWDERVGHVRNYQDGELEDKLSRAGFVLKRELRWGFPFFSPLARLLQNRSQVAAGKFGGGARLAAEAMYLVYFLNSARRGDLLIAVAGVDLA
jgi:SAM-dependent methyltransferase